MNEKHNHLLLQEIKDFCIRQYLKDYAETEKVMKRKKPEVRERLAQKQAIQTTFFNAIQTFPSVDAAKIWGIIYNAHIHRKSGISDDDTIDKVVSADQSWKKTSGHAFEELIQEHATAALTGTGIRIVLQRELSRLLKKGEIHNAKQDLDWLVERLKQATFDLFAIVTTPDGKNLVFGCIQSKTSIRDRVTRDREPSLAAMKHFFWSVCIALDGDFLQLPKFQAMVNGGSQEFPQNGWHGLYVLSAGHAGDRIYSIDKSFSLFCEHARQAAEYWLTQRQWFNENWKATLDHEQP